MKLKNAQTEDLIGLLDEYKTKLEKLIKAEMQYYYACEEALWIDRFNLYEERINAIEKELEKRGSLG